MYGKECLAQAAADCREMVDFLNEKLGDVVEIVLMPTVETAKLCVQDIRASENDDDCVGVITWMHTFSPANVIAGIRRFAEVAKAIDLSRDLTVAIDAKMAEYTSKYTMATDDIASVREQAGYEVALEKFIAKNGIGAFSAVLMKMSENREGAIGDDTTEADIRKF